MTSQNVMKLETKDILLGQQRVRDITLITAGGSSEIGQILTAIFCDPLSNGCKILQPPLFSMSEIL